MRNTKAEIIAIARQRFAQYGYDGVSTRMLAKDVGISVSTLNYHINSKAELYALIFEEAFLQESELVLSFCESVDDGMLRDPERFRDVVLGFVHNHIELMVEYPEAPRLWLQRWLATPDSQMAQINVDFGTHLYQAVRDLLRRAQAHGVLKRPFNMRYFLLGFTWMQYGFFSDGSHPAQDEAAIEQFKTHMSLYVCNMLGLSIPTNVLNNGVGNGHLALS